MNRFINLGVIKNNRENYIKILNDFESVINKLKSNMKWNKKPIVDEIKKLIPDFNYNDKKRYLDGKM